MALEVSAIELGLLPGELVLRGGLLKGPTVVQGVKRVQDCGYVYLWKTARWLNEFLAGSMKATRPLSLTNVPEGLQELRERARHELVRSVTGHGSCGSDSASGLDGCGPGCVSEDPTAAMGFDAPEASPPRLPKKRRQAVSKNLLPSTVEVTLEKEGFGPWRVRLLLERPQQAVAMEASTENLTALYLRVQADLAASRSSGSDAGRGRPKKKAAAAQARRQPRHYEDGSKEYDRGSRWVRKFPAAAVSARPAFVWPGWKKQKVLKRRHTEDAAETAAARSSRPAGLAAGSAPAAAEEEDPLAVT